MQPLVKDRLDVAGDQRIPFSQPSAYTGSGDWAPGDDPDTLDLRNWANVSTRCSKSSI